MGSCGTLTLQGISPNISSSIQIVNGQISRSESVRFTCHFRFVAAEAGLLPIGPFAMQQGATTKRTPLVQVEVRQVPVDGRMKVRLRVPQEPIYLGQRVLVEIEWWLGDGLEDRIHSYAIRSPLFDMEDRVRFVDDVEPQRNQQVLLLDTAGGELRLAAETRREREGGMDYLVLRARRTLIPLRSGTFELGAAHVQVEEITQYSRDLFGRRSAAGTRRLLARDLARTLDVKPPPSEGRPASYAGAVGRGFSLDVSADRSVVQVGDPILLTLTIEGDGNMATIGLPPLSAEGGLDPARFRLPDGDVFGSVRGDAKTFEVAVRVSDENVDEIPALSYSWFDPDRRRYETTQSRPIALSVRPAQVVAAADVVSATPAAPLEDERASAGESTSGDVETARSGASPRGFAIENADLSIERDLDTLRGRRSSARLLPPIAYASSLALLAGAFFVRRRAEIDPLVLRRRDVLASALRRVEGAREATGETGLAELAAALREVLAVIPEARSEQSDRILLECEDALYAPTGVSGTLDPELHERASALLREIGRQA